MKIHKKAKMCHQEILIPKKFNLLGTIWKVRYSKQILSSKKTHTCSGQVNFETREILLKEGWQQIHNTLNHELAHIFGHLTSADISGCDKEVFAKLSALFWAQVQTQMPVISSTLIKKKSKIKTKKRKKNG